MTAFPTGSHPNDRCPLTASLLGANTKRLHVGFTQLRELRAGTDGQTESGAWRRQLRGSSAARRRRRSEPSEKRRRPPDSVPGSNASRSVGSLPLFRGRPAQPGAAPGHRAGPAARGQPPLLAARQRLAATTEDGAVPPPRSAAFRRGTDGGGGGARGRGRRWRRARARPRPLRSAIGRCAERGGCWARGRFLPRSRRHCVISARAPDGPGPAARGDACGRRVAGTRRGFSGKRIFADQLSGRAAPSWFSPQRSARAVVVPVPVFRSPGSVELSAVLPLIFVGAEMDRRRQCDPTEMHRAGGSRNLFVSGRFEPNAARRGALWKRRMADVGRDLWVRLVQPCSNRATRTGARDTSSWVWRSPGGDAATSLVPVPVLQRLQCRSAPDVWWQPLVLALGSAGCSLAPSSVPLPAGIGGRGWDPLSCPSPG